jgi:hypothetical protein
VLVDGAVGSAEVEILEGVSQWVKEAVAAGAGWTHEPCLGDQAAPRQR